MTEEVRDGGHEARLRGDSRTDSPLLAARADAEGDDGAGCSALEARTRSAKARARASTLSRSPMPHQKGRTLEGQHRATGLE